MKSQAVCIVSIIISLSDSFDIDGKLAYISHYTAVEKYK